MTVQLNTEAIESNTRLLELFTTLKSLTDNSFLVGGIIRDLILNKEPKDFDIVTDININDLAPILADNGWEVKETGIVFSILFVSERNPNTEEVTEDVVRANGWCLESFRRTNKEKFIPQTFEIANFRRDVNSNGRRPESINILSINENLSIEENIIEDALRRDFSIGSLYLEPFTMKIIDPTGNGLEHIKNKQLRFNGKIEERLQEDWLRLFRYYRFLHKGFNHSKECLEKINGLFETAFLRTEPERIRGELEKMCKSDLLNHSDSVKFIHEKKYLNDGLFIFDEENRTFSFEQNVNHKNIIHSNPLSVFHFYKYVIKGFKPNIKTLRSVREHFKNACSSIKDNDIILVKNIIEQEILNLK